MDEAMDEDENEEENERNEEIELRKNSGTQTEVPAGELLQEVQRLQELRAKIQERAVKVPMTTESKAPCALSHQSETVDQVSFYLSKPQSSCFFLNLFI